MYEHLAYGFKALYYQLQAINYKSRSADYKRVNKTNIES